MAVELLWAAITIIDISELRKDILEGSQFSEIDCW